MSYIWKLILTNFVNIISCFWLFWTNIKSYALQPNRNTWHTLLEVFSQLFCKLWRTYWSWDMGEMSRWKECLVTAFLLQTCFPQIVNRTLTSVLSKELDRDFWISELSKAISVHWLLFLNQILQYLFLYEKISKWKAIVDWQWLPTSRDDISGQPIQPCSCSTREDDTKNSKYLRPTWVVAHTHTNWKCIFTADGSKVLYFMIFLNLENTCNAI